MSVFKRGNVYWYHFVFAGRHIQEPAKTTSKTLARAAEQRRRRELEEGFNSLADNRKERIRTIAELASDYLEEYKLRNRSSTFAEYALNHVKRLVGSFMVIDATERTILDYQSTRLKENAAPKTINEEVGFLLRLLGDSRRYNSGAAPPQEATKAQSSGSGRQGIQRRGEGALVRRGHESAIQSHLSRPRPRAELRASRQGDPATSVGNAR